MNASTRKTWNAAVTKKATDKGLYREVIAHWDTVIVAARTEGKTPTQAISAVVALVKATDKASTKAPAKKAPAKKAPSKKAAAKPEVKAAKAPKTLTKGVAKRIRARYPKKYAGKTPAQMIEAGLKGYVLPTGQLRASFAEKRDA